MIELDWLVVICPKKSKAALKATFTSSNLGLPVILKPLLTPSIDFDALETTLLIKLSSLV